MVALVQRPWRLVVFGPYRRAYGDVVATYSTFAEARACARERLAAAEFAQAVVVHRDLRRAAQQWAGANPGHEGGPWAPVGLSVETVHLAKPRLEVVR